MTLTYFNDLILLSLMSMANLIISVGAGSGPMSHLLMIDSNAAQSLSLIALGKSRSKSILLRVYYVLGWLWSHAWFWFTYPSVWLAVFLT